MTCFNDVNDHEFNCFHVQLYHLSMYNYMSYLPNPKCFHLLSNLYYQYYFMYHFSRKIHSSIKFHQILICYWLYLNLMMSCLVMKNQCQSDLFDLILYYYLERSLAQCACSFIQANKMYLYMERHHLLARQIHRSLLLGLYGLFNIYRLFLLSTRMNSFHLRRKCILDLSLVSLYLFCLHNHHY